MGRGRNKSKDEEEERETYPPLPDELDGSCTRSDLIYALQNLPLSRRNAVCKITIDREVRDYLVSALQRR